MELRDKAKEILGHLIRNRFDRLNTCGLLTTGPDLITIAREAGLAELATEMENDLRQELPPHLYGSTIRSAA
ncbi:hypothetical protein BH09BAC1_BH09BAC1_19560 [soil metagenome]